MPAWFENDKSWFEMDFFLQTIELLYAWVLSEQWIWVSCKCQRNLCISSFWLKRRNHFLFWGVFFLSVYDSVLKRTDLPILREKMGFLSSPPLLSPPHFLSSPPLSSPLPLLSPSLSIPAGPFPFPGAAESAFCFSLGESGVLSLLKKCA